MGKILLYGNDPALLLTRSLILKHAGSQVFATSDLDREFALMAMMEPDVLVLCQSLNMGERETALILAQELRPQMKILVMLEAGSTDDDVTPNGKALYALDGPQALLTAVDRMLSESKSSESAY
jgi:hypothetical protein